MRRLALGAALAVIWLLLWDEITWGQLIAGGVVAAALLILLPAPPGSLEPRLTVRPLALLRLLGWFTWQFALSNLYVVRAALFPKRWVHTGVVRVRLRSTSPTLAALVSNITALTPGMQPVDGRPDGSVVDVHVLSLGTEEGVNRTVHKLEDLVLAAFDRATPPAEALHGPGSQAPTDPAGAEEGPTGVVSTDASPPDPGEDP